MPRGTGVTACQIEKLTHRQWRARQALSCRFAGGLLFCFFSPELSPQQFSVTSAGFLELTCLIIYLISSEITAALMVISHIKSKHWPQTKSDSFCSLSSVDDFFFLTNFEGNRMRLSLDLVLTVCQLFGSGKAPPHLEPMHPPLSCREDVFSMKDLGSWWAQGQGLISYQPMMQ